MKTLNFACTARCFESSFLILRFELIIPLFIVQLFECLWSGRSRMFWFKFFNNWIWPDNAIIYCPVIQVVARSCLEWEVWGLNQTQSCQRLATTATFLRKERCCLAGMTWKRAPQTRYMLWHNTVSIMKDLIIIMILLHYNNVYILSKIDRVSKISAIVLE